MQEQGGEQLQYIVVLQGGLLVLWVGQFGGQGVLIQLEVVLGVVWLGD